MISCKSLDQMITLRCMEILEGIRALRLSKKTQRELSPPLHAEYLSIPYILWFVLEEVVFTKKT